MQVCTSLQTDNHASTPPLSFYRPDALIATQQTNNTKCTINTVKTRQNREIKKITNQSMNQPKNAVPQAFETKHFI